MSPTGGGLEKSSEQMNMHAASLGERLGAQLGASILRGELNPGDHLPTEHELCEAHDLSRSAVREALKMIAAKGLIESRTRRGTVVTPREQWNLLDPDVLDWMQQAEYSHQLLFELGQVRMAIEPEACALVAQNRAMVDFSPMGEAISRMNRGEGALLEADTDFHLAILDATGNRFYRQMKPLVRTTLRFGYECADLFDLHGTERAENVHEHQTVMQAMLDGRAEEARAISRSLMSRLLDLVERELRSGSGESVASG